MEIIRGKQPGAKKTVIYGPGRDREVHAGFLLPGSAVH